MTLQPVADARVWRHVRRMYVSAGLLFLVNVFLGFMNVLDAGGDAQLARWQLLTHLHAGTIGWITFSIIATAVWVFTGQRQVSDRYAAGVGVLGWFAFVAFGGYIVSFAYAFSRDALWGLLPIFGIASMLAIWTGFGYTLVAMRHQPVVSTPHLLLAGALGIGSLGALMGVLIGLGYALADFAAPGSDPIGQHAGVMDSYLLMGFAAMIEAVAVGTGIRRTKGGITQTSFWVLTGLVTLVALFLGLEPVAGLAVLLVLGGLVTYLVRMAKHTFRRNPLHGDTNIGIFFAGLWLPIYVLLFAALIGMFISGTTIPAWYWVVFAHVLFVGVATQIVIVMMSAFARHRPVAREAVTGGLWLLNLGMLAFFIGSYTDGLTHGAAVMGVGILVALFATWARMMGPGATQRTSV